MTHGVIRHCLQLTFCVKITVQLIAVDCFTISAVAVLIVALETDCRQSLFFAQNHINILPQNTFKAQC